MSVVIDCNSIADMYIQCCQTPPAFPIFNYARCIDYILRSARFRCYVESGSGIINMTYLRISMA